MNQAFKDKLKEATTDQVYDFLEALQQHYDQIPSHQKGTFNQLKKEFTDQPNNFSLGSWRSRLLVLISGFDFDVAVPTFSSSSSSNSGHRTSGDNVAGDKIGKQINVGRDYIETQYKSTNQGSSKSDDAAKQKILFLSANPQEAARLQIDKEYSTIKQYLERSSQRDTFELLNPALSVTVQDLIKVMNQKPEIVHFSGHSEQEGIVIATSQNEAQIMPTSAVRRLFKQHKDSTKLVILNACYSAEQAKVISEFGIHVIGMNDVTEDNAAISFASGLYIGIGEGKAIEQAFDDAMIVVETEHSSAEVVPEVWLNGEKMPW